VHRIHMPHSTDHRRTACWPVALSSGLGRSTKLTREQQRCCTRGISNEWLGGRRKRCLQRGREGKGREGWGVKGIKGIHTVEPPAGSTWVRDTCTWAARTVDTDKAGFLRPLQHKRQRQRYSGAPELHALYLSGSEEL